MYDRVHVLHVSEAFGGGIQTAIGQYVSAAPWAKHSVVARSRSGHDVGNLNTLGGVEVIQTGSAIRDFIGDSVSEIKRIRPDVVHLHSSIAGALRVHPSLKNVRMVYTPHCYAFERLDKSLVSRACFILFESLCGFRRHTIAGVSKHEESIAERISLRAHSVHLPNCAPAPSDNMAIGCDNSSGRARVVAIGRVCHQKDPELFALIAREVSRQAPDLDIEWVWVGDGDPESRTVLEEAGVAVTGWVPLAEVQQELRGASLYLHTALWEGDPLAPLEARSLGIPIILRKTRTTKALPYWQQDSVEALSRAVVMAITDAGFRARLMDYASDVFEQLELNQRVMLERIYVANRPSAGVRGAG